MPGPAADRLQPLQHLDVMGGIVALAHRRARAGRVPLPQALCELPREQVPGFLGLLLGLGVFVHGSGRLGRFGHA